MMVCLFVLSSTKRIGMKQLIRHRITILALLLALAPLSLPSCAPAPDVVDITHESDNSQLVAAVEDVNKSLCERMSLLEAALESGLADSQTMLALVQKAVESLRGDMEEKLAALSEAVRSQGAGLETKLALIEAAMNSGFADEAAQQALLAEAIASMGGTLEEKISALETVMNKQGTALETKLGLLEAAVKDGLADNAAAQGLLKEAIASMGGTLEDQLAAIDSALVSRQADLSAKLLLIETAVQEGFAGGKTQQELILQALDSLGAGQAELLSEIDSVLVGQTASLLSKLDLMETALTAGFTSDVTALQQLQTLVTALKGKVDGMDRKMDGILATLGTFDASTVSVAAALSDIRTAVSGLSTDGEKLAAIERTLILLTGIVDGHAFVDMGNGLLWATCNVGAKQACDTGYFFAWGETVPKTDYSWDTYFDTNDNGKTFEKYAIDKKTVLEPKDDAACANWGGSWRTPTIEEWQWLKEHTQWEWKENYIRPGIHGFLLTSTVPGYESQRIFLPRCGSRMFKEANSESLGLYWSSSLKMDMSIWAMAADMYVADESNRIFFDVASGTSRYYGFPVRPVSDYLMK